MRENQNVEGKMAWTVHPLRKNWKTSLGVILLLVVIWFVVFLGSGGSWLFVGLAVLLLLGSLSQFFFPTIYSMDQEGIKVRFPFSRREKRWCEFQSFYVDKHGVLLSPFRRPSRLESFRGLYVRFAGNREQVIDFVTSKVEGG